MKIARILDPSRGGTGIRLKAQSKMLMSKVVCSSPCKKGGKSGANFKGMASRTAKRKLEAGPARAVRAWSLLGWVK